MRVIDFEAWAAEQGFGRSALGDAGMHTRIHASDAAWRRQMSALQSDMAAWQAERERLRQEYARLVEAGEMREMTSLERLELTALGDDDLPSVQAARRVLEKRKARNG